MPSTTSSTGQAKDVHNKRMTFQAMNGIFSVGEAGFAVSAAAAL